MIKSGESDMGAEEVRGGRAFAKELQSDGEGAAWKERGTLGRREMGWAGSKKDKWERGLGNLRTGKGGRQKGGREKEAGT